MCITSRLMSFQDRPKKGLRRNERIVARSGDLWAGKVSLLSEAWYRPVSRIRHKFISGMTFDSRRMNLLCERVSSCGYYGLFRSHGSLLEMDEGKAGLQREEDLARVMKFVEFDSFEPPKYLVKSCQSQRDRSLSTRKPIYTYIGGCP